MFGLYLKPNAIPGDVNESLYRFHAVIMVCSLFFFWVALLTAVVVGQSGLSVELLLYSSLSPPPRTVGYLSHTAVTWLPWFSHIILVRVVHCAIELTGCVPHKSVTLTNAWTAE